MEQVDASIQRYLGMLDTADRQDSEAAELRTTRLTERLGELRRQMRELEAMEQAVAASPDRQISLTDPDARAMASAGTGTGQVGYNLQAAVDAGSHIVVAHEVINLGHDRTSLANMGHQAREATGAETLTVLADRGYFSGPEVLACEEAGITPICPKPLTSGAKADGRWANRTSSISPTATPTVARPARR
jgi:DNA-binding transcriptional MerR regulator